ncbi:MAG: folate-binding protein YgfZ [Kiritimatiellia bacterium]|jgi:folate-binding protein YgfZ
MSLSMALRAARGDGIAGRCGADGGLASPAVVCFEGPDAAKFLHGQVTNDVVGLEVGQGNLSARVSRTGHLQAVFSVHRVAEDTLWLLCAAEDADALYEHLEAFHFADDLRIYLLDAAEPWALIQGPAVAQVLLDRGAQVWADGLVFNDGPGVVLGRSLTGDRGLVLRGPSSWLGEWLDAARRSSLTLLDVAGLSAAIETLRIETGLLRTVLELKKRRLLPGTGLEQRAVSYSKGCYLGQEVISRVRTYGNVPWALRALLFRDDCLDALEAPARS